MLICKNCLDKELLENSVCSPCSLRSVALLVLFPKEISAAASPFPPPSFPLPSSWDKPTFCWQLLFLSHLTLRVTFLLPESRKNPMYFSGSVPFIIWSTINNTWRAYLKYQLIYWKKKTAASNCSPAETRSLTTAINCMKIFLTSQRGYSQGRG